MEQEKKRTGVIIFGVAVMVFLVVFLGVMFTQNIGKSQKTVNTEKAEERIARLLTKIDVTTAPEIKSPVDILSETSLADELPPIDDSGLALKGKGDINIEIFSSPEKADASSKENSWLLDEAKEFNSERYEVNGKTVSISVRNINSGLAVDYIVSGAYTPELFSPSSELWGRMIEANGVDIEKLTDRLAGNVAGIVIKNDKYEELVEKYGSVNIRTVSDAVINGELLFGYTTPYESSTGLNFLTYDLYQYDSNDILSDEAIEQFVKFQNNIPFVATITAQMKDASQKGVLDGFVFESQVYENSSDIKRNYTFTPFGIRHDNPVYQIGSLSSDEEEAVEIIMEYLTSDEARESATDYGFNTYDDYKVEYSGFTGDDLIEAQKLWKENKDTNKDIVAVFVADVSGSMDGEPLNMLKSSLINSMSYINTNNYIGLVSYSTDVVKNCEIRQFDLNQQSLFKGAVESLEANGSTATIDGLIVAADMISKEMANHENAKAMIFLLSDGDNNRGHTLSDIDEVIEQLGYPIYTISYNADVRLMSQLSEINEAAEINATSDDVVYKIKNLFNSNL